MVHLRKLSVFVLLILSFSALLAQTGSEINSQENNEKQCKYDLSEMAEFTKINLYEDALPAFRRLIVNCPESSKNIYINGAKIYQWMIEQTDDPVLRSGYYDTLMMIYDKRISYFGEEGNVLGRKGKDILKYNSKDFENAYRSLRGSMDKSGTETDPVVLVGVVETGVLMLNSNKISVQELLSDYITVLEIVSTFQSKGVKPEVISQVVTRSSTALQKTSLISCSDFETALSGQLKTSPEGRDILLGLTGYMTSLNCEGSPYFLNLSEKLYILEPNPEMAFKIAWILIRKEEFSAAINYLNQAIDLESDPLKEAHYYYQMALISSTRMNMHQEAVKYANEAIKLNSSWGEPYLVIANAYIAGINECFKEVFDRSTVYWAATDKCEQAKAIDPGITEKANNLIEDYTRYYPDKEELFFRSISEGSNYTVGCWINEKTTARAKK